ncbi:TPA: SDR family NAD(P)-dependent oxidoreductase [Candidatus Poribacteria bacterium]|jgi:NAD(P)-dependent dehydrogenase (short-subunit alcohol dehydrogenase family)|nr:SDR family NAD(P)-dependent oxidoreductase [Candidatus Poribacteria bacterium]HIO80388.1 SDR family NAD(P)-dependent oxidoreductase [Candidatus Poribacteria bacterium]
MLLKDKVIVVTGGAEGLGRTTALQCADIGGRVIVADVNLDGAEDTARTITSNGGRACAVAVDLAREDQVARLIEQTENIFSRLDILINCAGILLNAGQRVDQFNTESWTQVIEVNLSGSFFCVKHAVPLLEKSGGGVLVLLASGAGIFGGSSSVAYAASKGGVRGIALCVKSQLQPLNIRIHVALPANMATHMKIKAAGDSAERHGESRQEAEAKIRAECASPEASATFLAELVSDDGAVAAVDHLVIGLGDWEGLKAAVR